jgi:LysM repeat protein
MRRLLARIFLVIAIVIVGYLVLYKPIFKREESPPPLPPAPVSPPVKTEAPPPTPTKVETKEMPPPPPPPRVETEEKRSPAVELLRRAQAMIAAGTQKEEAKEILEKLTVAYKGTAVASQAYFELGKLYLDENNKYAARNAFSDALPGLDATRRAQAIQHLNELNAFLIFSPANTKDALMHVVESGDTVVQIARKYSTTSGLIKRINNLADVNKIRVGQRLKVISGTWKIYIDKSAFRMQVYLNDHFVKEYPIGIGQYDKTPEGEFVINVKQERATWYSPEGPIPYGDPRYLLGERWLGFKPTEEFTGYGIHGTNDKTSIGKPSSQGCIRLLNDDVIEVYDMIPEGTKAYIRP